MKKTLIIASSVVAGIALPILGLTLSPSRDLILGLAPDQAVLTLADKIDENRVSADQSKAENDAKITELESTISSQQQLIDQQTSVIAEQKASVEGAVQSVQAETKAVQAKVNNEAECIKLYADNKYCESKQYRSKSEYDSYIDKQDKSNENAVKICKEHSKSIGKTDNNCDSNKTDYDFHKTRFEKCQNIITKCG